MPLDYSILAHYRGFIKKIIKKIIWRKTVEMYNVFKKKNYKAKFSTSFILKKLKSKKIILEKIIRKKNKRKKNM
jgi:hypothetical protein